MSEILVKVVVEKGGHIPVMKTSGAACFDCYACLPDGPVTIEPGKRKVIPLGIRIQLAKNCEAVIRPRSGNTKDGIDVGIGTIDSDYTGVVGATIINNSDKDFVVNDFDRVCQMAIRRYEDVSFVITDELEKTERGDKGYGSTGK